MLAFNFFHFPDSPLELISSLVTLLIFVLLAVGTTYFISKKSQKDERMFDEKYSGQFQDIEKETKHDEPKKN